MKPTEEQLDLIKSCIIQHPYYDQKKCRMGEFVNLVYDKAALFLNSITNENTLRKYITKIVGENLEKCNIATDIAQIQQHQENFLNETLPDVSPVQFEEIEPEEFSLDKGIETPQDEEGFKSQEFNPEEFRQQPDELQYQAKKEVKEEVINFEPQTFEFEEIDVEIEYEDDDEDEDEDPKFIIEEENTVIEVVQQPPSAPPTRPLTVPPAIPPTQPPKPHALPVEPQEAAYKDIEDPIEGTKTRKVSKELTEKIINIVGAAHKEEPEQQYSKIFYMKYAKKMRQSEIARRLEISEEELSDRYLKLVRIVKRELG